MDAETKPGKGAPLLNAVQAGERGAADGALNLDQDPDWLPTLDDAFQLPCRSRRSPGEMVELRFFGGLTVEETAEAMNGSAKTVKRDWTVVRAWLRGELRSCPPA